VTNFMENRHHHPQRIAAAKSGFSERTARCMPGEWLAAAREHRPRRCRIRSESPSPADDIGRGRAMLET
jgi:hypothetical protein